MPAFGDPDARLLIVGLAPGRHGANASGRPFTGDFAGVLLYQTLDGTETGSWDQRQRVWIPASEFQSSVRQGLRIARKHAAPDLLRLPVPAAEPGSERAERAQ